MKNYLVEINEAYILNPLLPCASLKVFTDRICFEANNPKNAKKKAVEFAKYIYKGAFKMPKPDAIEAVAVKEI